MNIKSFKQDLRGSSTGDFGFVVKTPHAEADMEEHTELPNMAHIHEIRVQQTAEKGKGEGTRILQNITKAADKHGITLLLRAQPIRSGLDRKQLVGWYERHNFEHVHPDDLSSLFDADPEDDLWKEMTHMIRHPNTETYKSKWGFRKQVESFTPGLINAVGKSENRVCKSCNKGIPKYPGRYPKNCPYCEKEIE